MRSSFIALGLSLAAATPAHAQSSDQPDGWAPRDIVVTGKREEDGQQLVDLEVTLANQDGEVKVAGEAVATAA